MRLFPLALFFCLQKAAKLVDESSCYKSLSVYPGNLLSESYVRFLPDLLGDKDFIIPEFKRYIKMMNSKGITSIKEMGFDDFYGFTDILAELESENALTIRVNFMSQPVAEPFNLSYGKKCVKNLKESLFVFLDITK